MIDKVTVLLQSPSVVMFESCFTFSDNVTIEIQHCSISGMHMKKYGHNNFMDRTT